MTNVHENCENFNARKDFCLKFVEHNVSTLAECKKELVFTDNIGVIE